MPRKLEIKQLPADKYPSLYLDGELIKEVVGYSLSGEIDEAQILTVSMLVKLETQA